MYREDQQIDYSKKDGMFAIAYLFMCIIWVFIFFNFISLNLTAYLVDAIGKQLLVQLIVGILASIPLLLPMILRLRIMNQDISSIGMKRTDWRESFKLGLQACVLVLVIRFYHIPGAIESLSYMRYSDLLFLVIYYLVIISFTEEVIFRAFIPSRLNGLISNKWIRTLLVGLMFSLLHFPNYGFSMINLKTIGGMIVVHFFLMYLYNRHTNIIAPIMVHTIWNLMSVLNAK